MIANLLVVELLPSFSRTAAAVVFDVSRMATFSSVQKVSL